MRLTVANFENTSPTAGGFEYILRPWNAATN